MGMRKSRLSTYKQDRLNIMKAHDLDKQFDNNEDVLRVVSQSSFELENDPGL